MIGSTTITRLRWSYAADAYGDMQRTGTPASSDIRGCTVNPRSSSDVTEPARQGIVVGYTVLAPASAVIDAVTDQIGYNGDTYDIEGDVGAWSSPYSKINGIEFGIRRAVG